MNRTFKFVDKVPSNFPGETAPKFIALDIETTGLNPRKDQIVGISLATSDKAAIYTTDLEGVKCLIHNTRQAELIFHNAVFDLQFLKTVGWDFLYDRTIHDTMF